MDVNVGYVGTQACSKKSIKSIIMKNRHFNSVPPNLSTWEHLLMLMILSIVDQLIIFLNKFCGQITANKEDHMAAS